MGKKLIIYLIVSLSLFVLFNPVFAEKTLKDILSEKYVKGKDICGVVKETIQEGINTKGVIKTSIEMGHSACLVVKCAIEGGGNLEQIIIGAIEAGATADVVSKCAIEAGADPDKIARILEREGLPGLGYTPPPEAGPATIAIGLPGGGTGGGFLSPSSF